MTTLTADHIPGQTLAQSFRAAILRFLDTVLKSGSHDDAGTYVWGRGL
jgi:hypothetical protein